MEINYTHLSGQTPELSLKSSSVSAGLVMNAMLFLCRLMGSIQFVAPLASSSFFASTIDVILWPVLVFTEW